MSSDWARVKLSEVMTVKHGFAFKGEHFTEAKTAHVLTTPGNFAIGGGFQVGKRKYYAGPVPNEYVLHPGDLLITMTDLSKQCDTLGYSAKLPAGLGSTYLHNQRIGRVLVKPDSPAAPCWLYYLLRTKPYRDWVVGSATGSTVRHTSPERICSFVAKVPPLQLQQRICRVLDPLEAAIEVARAESSTLQRLAQAVFHSWFVQFEPVQDKTEGLPPSNVPAALWDLLPAKLNAVPGGLIPEGWSVGTLGDLCENVRVQAKPESIATGTPYVGLEHVPRKDLSLASWGESDGLASAKFRFAQNDILFGKLRPYFHKVALAPVAGVCSTDILVLRPKRTEYLPFVLMTVFSEAFVANATRLSDGAKMPRTNWKDMAAYPVPLPPADVLNVFYHLVSPMLDVLQVNVALERTLSQLRDELLPRLMSGSIGREDAEAAVRRASEASTA